MDYSIGKKKEIAGMSCHDIYKEINTRMSAALTFHDQMADLYDFLGLNGFKRMHEYRHLSETAEKRGLKRYYINHHNKLLPTIPTLDLDIIPLEWAQYKRQDVSSQVRKQAVEKSFLMYRKWEHETKECYENYAKAFLEKGKIADFTKISELVCDVDMELKKIDRIILCLSASSYDEVYILSIQEELHEKYKNKQEK